MFKLSTFHIVYLVIFYFTFLELFGFAYSDRPGYHTTIWPPYVFIIEAVLSMLLLFEIFIYHKFTSLYSYEKPTVLFVHYVLTVPVILILQFPSLLLFQSSISKEFEQIKRQIELLDKLLWTLYILFFVGQLFFIIYVNTYIFSKRFRGPGYS